MPIGDKSRIVYVSNGEDILLPPPGLDLMHFDNYTLGRRSAQLLLQMVDGTFNKAEATSLVIPAVSTS